MMKNERIEWIDIAKGIGIILMVIGHLGIPQYLSNWIYSFHMPLFLFLSGLVFNVGGCSFKKLLKKRLLQLLVPYIGFSIIVFTGNYFLPVTSWLSKDVCVFLIYGNQSALWFLPVLFVTQLIAFPVLKLCNDMLSKTILFIVITILILWCDSFSHGIYYSMSAVPLSLLFFIIGALSRDRILIINNVKYNIILSAGFFFFSFVLSQLFSPPVNVMNGHLGGYGLVSIFFSFVGIISTRFFSEFLSGFKVTKRFILYVGKNTLPVLGLSQLYYLYAKDLLALFNVPLYTSLTLRITFMCLALWGSILFINKNIPLLVGKIKG